MQPRKKNVSLIQKSMDDVVNSRELRSPGTSQTTPNNFSDDPATSQQLCCTQGATADESDGRGKQLRDIRSTKDISMFPTRDQKYNNTSKQCAAGGPVHATSLLAAWIVSPNAKIEIQKF